MSANLAAHGSNLIQAHTQPPHAGIDFQVNGLRTSVLIARGPLEQLKVPRLPDGRGQILADDFFFLAAPETSHQQNSSAQSGGTQRHSFVGGGYAEPLCSCSFEGQRARRRTVAVSIRLDDGADFNRLANVRAQGAEIAAQFIERNFRPGGTRRLSGSYTECRNTHSFKIISAADFRTNVTVGR